MYINVYYLHVYNIYIHHKCTTNYNLEHLLEKSADLLIHEIFIPIQPLQTGHGIQGAAAGAAALPAASANSAKMRRPRWAWLGPQATPPKYTG